MRTKLSLRPGLTITPRSLLQELVFAFLLACPSTGSRPQMTLVFIATFRECSFGVDNKWEVRRVALRLIFRNQGAA
jgi:hypothetical protein